MRRRFLQWLSGTVLVVGTLLTIGLTTMWGAPADPPDPPGFDQVIAIQNRHTPGLLAIEGVVGTATGVDAQGRLAVKVYVAGPGVAGIPKRLDGAPVDVVVSGHLEAMQKPTSRFPRPVPIGVSTGNKGECSAGTIGARLAAVNQSGAVQAYYALSNNHVYALENTAPIGSDVLQPGLYDTACVFSADNIIGTLANYVPIVFSSGANNTVDAAIGATTTSLVGTSTPTNGYGTPKSAIVAAALNQAVQKYGRTTSLTKGVVTGVNATVLVGYSSGTARFVNQIIVERQKNAFIKPGDSGSLLVTDPGRNPVGLLFAGNTSGRLAVANRIDLVLGAFSDPGNGITVRVDGQ